MNNKQIDLLDSCSITYEINKSKFIAYLFLNITNHKSIKEILEVINKQYKKASHICFAYHFYDHVNKQTYIKAYDAKEPKHSAGYMILKALEQKHMQNCLLVVVRYFGGIKLGKSVLARSYFKASLMIIDKLNKN